MNIKLIAPDIRGESNFSSAQLHKVLKVNLPLLAALVPPGHAVKIVDESFAPDDPDEDVDLVGITVMTELAPRAYRIAEGYRARGVKVVMGGIHPTVLPEEVLQHADAVVVGEGESVWPQLVNDAAHGKLQSIYRSPAMTDLATLPFPRRAIYPKPLGSSYTPVGVGIETSRGCPFNCEFCSTTHVLGKQMRMRPAKQVIREMETITSRYLFFVDDSLGLNRKEAKNLFAEMKPLRKYWIGQGTASLAEDVELLHLMKQCGCQGLLIGLESIHQGSREKMRKLQASKISISEAVHRFHGEGIPLLGAFVFGFDEEDKSIFERTTEFVLTHRIEALQLRVLLPFPGTQLYERLLEENRLFDSEWWLREYPPGTLLFRLKRMTADEFMEGYNRMVKELFSVRNMVIRFFGIAPWKRSALDFAIYAGVNFGYRKRYLTNMRMPHLHLS